MRLYRTEVPNMFDRGISVLSYFTFGTVGFIWMVVCYFAGKPPMPFVKYHIIQSIFISVCITLFQIIFSILSNALNIIPAIGAIVQNLIYYVASYPLIFHNSVLQIFIFSFLIYVTVTVFQGKYTEIPWFSDMVRKIA
jgi:uncharacterized membrane protein